jgi:hypothetical protein
MNIENNIAIYASVSAVENEAAITRGKIRAAWRKLAATRSATASQHAALALLLGIPLDKAFTPITNPTKLAHGQSPNQGRDQAVATALSGHGATWAPWIDLLPGAKLVENRWGGGSYDMTSHELLRSATAAGQAS